MKIRELKTLLRSVAAALMASAVLGGCGAQPEAVQTQDAAQGTENAEPEEVTESNTPAAESTEESSTEEAGETPPAAGEEETEQATECPLEDGVYSAVFDTDNSMFHVNEACEGRGVLTVANGEMSMHIVMPSQNIVNLYFGLAEDAQKDGAVLIDPTVESVTYSDGMTEEVFAFDFPVPYLDETFDLALIGTKGVWYDHKVSVSDPVPQDAAAAELSDGTYQIEVTLEGGSGRATITSPAELTVEGGKATLKVEWSSPNYDYMLVDGTKYEPVNTDGNSVFLIPVADVSADLAVIGDTTAMSEPHEISYTIRFGEVK